MLHMAQEDARAVGWSSIFQCQVLVFQNFSYLSLQKHGAQHSNSFHTQSVVQPLKHCRNISKYIQSIKTSTNTLSVTAQSPSKH